MLRFAANLSFLYNEHSFQDRFGAAARDGFKAVEYLFPYEFPTSELVTRLQENNLTQILFNAPPGNWSAGERGIACLPGRQAEFHDDFHKALAYAEALKCPRIHVMAGIAPSGVDRAILCKIFVSNLGWAAAEAQSVGKTILIEPINPHDMPGYFLTRQDEAHAIVAEVAAPNLKVQMDLYHCQIVHGDVTRKLRHYLSDSQQTTVGHIQVAGVPDRNEPNTGELNYNYLFDILEDLGYDGWIGCEYKPKTTTAEGLGWLRNLHDRLTQ